MSTAAPITDPSRPNDIAAGLDGTAAFAAVRSRLLAIAHRIVRRWSDAEDVVQDAWVRWQLCDRAGVADPTAFLVTTTTRLAINATQTARARREACVGDWLPELAAASDDPARVVEQALEHDVKEVLARLAPPERAAFVLYEAFEVPVPGDRRHPEDLGGHCSSARLPGPQAPRRRSQHWVIRPVTAVPRFWLDGSDASARWRPIEGEARWTS